MVPREAETQGGTAAMRAARVSVLPLDGFCTNSVGAGWAGFLPCVFNTAPDAAVIFD